MNSTIHHGMTKDCPSPKPNGSCPGHPTFENNTAYMLGRFLGLAQIARSPEIWGRSPEQIVAILLEIADEHDAAEKAKGAL